MKNIFPLFVFVLGSFHGFAQEAKLGFTAGYVNLQVTYYDQGTEITENASGFYAGVLGDFTLSEAFHLEPAALYAHVKDVNVLFIPIHAKYYIGQSGFNVLAGPQATIILDEIDPLVKRIGWDLSVGAGYDVTEAIFVLARYALEITNRHNSNFTSIPNDINAGINSLFAGIGYRF